MTSLNRLQNSPVGACCNSSARLMVSPSVVPGIGVDGSRHMPPDHHIAIGDEPSVSDRDQAVAVVAQMVETVLVVHCEVTRDSGLVRCHGFKADIRDVMTHES